LSLIVRNSASGVRRTAHGRLEVFLGDNVGRAGVGWPIARSPGRASQRPEPPAHQATKNVDAECAVMPCPGPARCKGPI